MASNQQRPTLEDWGSLQSQVTQLLDDWIGVPVYYSQPWLITTSDWDYITRETSDWVASTPTPKFVQFTMIIWKQPQRGKGKVKFQTRVYKQLLLNVIVSKSL